MRHTPDEIILEITACGGSQRVSAIDPVSLVEVVFQAPLGAHRTAIERLARQKLAFRLEPDRPPPRKPPRGGGTLV